MIEFVPFDLEVHRDEYIQLNIEYLTKNLDDLAENFNIDSRAMVGATEQQMAQGILESYKGLKPPQGVLFILKVDEAVAGMGAIKKLSESVGELKSMFIRPEYRGNGYGKVMVSQLMEAGREFGCDTFRLDTSKFMVTAQHIYRQAGFQERDKYLGSDVSAKWEPYWMWMEKIDHE